MKKIITALVVVMALGMIVGELYTALAELDVKQGIAPGCNLVEAYVYKIPNIIIDPCFGYTF